VHEFSREKGRKRQKKTEKGRKRQKKMKSLLLLIIIVKLFGLI
jgi:hypothetical protein